MTDHIYELCLAIGVVVPLLSFTLLVFFGPKIGKPLSGWIAVAACATSCLFSTYVLIGWLGMDPAERAAATANVFSWKWVELGSVPVYLGVKLDSLTVGMFFMVTFIATWIHVFSVGYMAGHSDEVNGVSKYHRFFAYLGLFCFSMLGLVIAQSLLFLFIFWELVGLCSYLLIGFYFDKKFASDAAMKAFITNRVGDFGFIFGLMIVFAYLGTLDLDQAAEVFRQQYQTGSGIFATTINLFGWEVSGMTVATLMGIGLFCGAMGKSAQFPLHVWLPDAMAGPTPVSALIHAATMVAAGVYLVARIFRLLTPDAQMFIAVIGCITLTLTALIAIVQTDIKKILAYSTLSQLGYMIFGLGVGAWVGALFHLITHAFFKAMLFLGSGQVIEGCHHEQDIRKMGGLRKKMPFTCWTFFIGVLAIAGAGIPFLSIPTGDHPTKIGLGGFFSKDEILAVAYERTYNWDERFGHMDDLDDHGESHSPSHDDPHARGGVTGFSGKPIHLVADPAHSAQGDSSKGHGDDGHGDDGHGDDGHGDDGDGHGHGSTVKHSVAAGIKSLPQWMFWLPIAIAYITPFYMMRCWWLTFCGRPRDEHVYGHAHESKLMFVPLIFLAIGTFASSYFLFRPMFAEAVQANADSPLVVAVDGEIHGDADWTLAVTHGDPGDGRKDVHKALGGIVGFAYVVGIGLAFLLYRGGLGTARRISELPLVRGMHTLLINKYYIDDLYDFVWVRGCRFVAALCRVIDSHLVDGAYNLSAAITERFARFTGRSIDAKGVDGIFNGTAAVAMDIGGALRRLQSGRIRHYVMLTTGAAVIVALVLVFGDDLGRWWGSLKDWATASESVARLR